MAISVTFLADIVDWVRGLGKSKDALDENAAGLEDLMRKAVELGRQAGKTGDEIARDFSDAFGVPLDRAKRAVEEVIRETEDLGDAGKKAGSEVEHGMDDAADGARNASRNIGDDLTGLGSIARDVLSGDIGGAASGAIDALGGIGVKAGAVAGIFAAVGGEAAQLFGSLISELVEAWDPFNEKTQEVRDNVASALAEMGGYFDEAAINARLREAASDTDTWNQAMTLAKVTGLSLGDSLRAVAGITKDETAAAAEALETALEDLSSITGVNGWELNALQQTLLGTAAGFGDGATRAETLSEAMRGTSDELADVDAKARAAAQGLGEIPANVSATVTVTVDDSAWRNWTPQTKAGVVNGVPATGQRIWQ